MPDVYILLYCSFGLRRVSSYTWYKKIEFVLVFFSGFVKYVLLLSLLRTRRLNTDLRSLPNRFVFRPLLRRRAVPYGAAV